MDIEKLKRMLDLKPLPSEGGFYRNPIGPRSDCRASAFPSVTAASEVFGTAIYFLLTPDTFSAMHRLASDEVYHFYLGDPVELLCLREDGSGEIFTIGTDPDAGMRPQIAVPRGTWQGSRLRPGGRFALLGTTVTPGV